jgi:hypothetical protein
LKIKHPTCTAQVELLNVASITLAPQATEADFLTSASATLPFDIDADTNLVFSSNSFFIEYSSSCQECDKSIKNMFNSLFECKDTSLLKNNYKLLCIYQSRYFSTFDKFDATDLIIQASLSIPSYKKRNSSR